MQFIHSCLQPDHSLHIQCSLYEKCCTTVMAILKLQGNSFHHSFMYLHTHAKKHTQHYNQNAPKMSLPGAHEWWLIFQRSQRTASICHNCCTHNMVWLNNTNWYLRLGIRSHDSKEHRVTHKTIHLDHRDTSAGLQNERQVDKCRNTNTRRDFVEGSKAVVAAQCVNQVNSRTDGWRWCWVGGDVGRHVWKITTPHL